MSKDDAPRKVLVGTVLHSFRSENAELEARIERVLSVLEEVAEEAARRYPGAGLDLVVLPEEALTEGRSDVAAERAVPLDGLVADSFGAAARRHAAYLLIPTALAERDGFYNAAVLFDRRGEVVGIYRKIHPVAYLGHTDMEGGMTPGLEASVFDCDFGRLGVQICFDIGFDDGWDLLAQKGAEIVAWPTASPQTVEPAFRARRMGCYIVSSTPRHNATIFDPSGLVAARIEPPQRVLVEQIDLSFMVLPWSQELRNGQALSELFGDRVGYRYSSGEDGGLFWSNDPSMSIGRMARRIGVLDRAEHWRNNLRLVEEARRGELC
jgi:predicted amidohydrolase